MGLPWGWSSRSQKERRITIQKGIDCNLAKPARPGQHAGAADGDIDTKAASRVN